MVRSFPIRALILPRIAHATHPTLRAASPTEAFRVLGPSTVIWLPGAEAASFRFIGKLVQEPPCYFLDLASNPADNLPLIGTGIEKHSL